MHFAPHRRVRLKILRANSQNRIVLDALDRFLHDEFTFLVRFIRHPRLVRVKLIAPEAGKALAHDSARCEKQNHNCHCGDRNQIKALALHSKMPEAHQPSHNQRNEASARRGSK